MVNLPISRLVPELLTAIKDHNSILLSAPPGSGKSTELPAVIYESGLIKGKILMLQPRRMAARALARRLAWRLGCQLGDLVGFSVRHERECSTKTVIEVLTEGLLTRRLLTDPFLDGVGMVILDEFHERSAESDLALAALREAQEISDLKIMVMSATLDNTIADYLPGTAILNLEYQPFPLTIKYLPPTTDIPLEKRISLGLKELLTAPDDDGGDILVFLPGQREIIRTATLLREIYASSGLVIQQLYGALSSKEQDAVLNPDLLPSERRVILATNIAQTSLTVPRVRAVIDAGLQKRSAFDAYSGFDRLTLGKCSQAAATQRSGRAARLGPGRAIRLWSRPEELSMPEFDPPEITISDPAPHLVWMQSMQPGWYQNFPFITPIPKPEIWLESLQNLQDMDILDKDGQHLTSLGTRISNYPLPPRLAKLVEDSRTGNVLYTGCTLAALLAGRDILDNASRDVAAGDIESRLDLLETWETNGSRPDQASAYSLNSQTLREFLETRRQILQLAGNFSAKEYDMAAIPALLTAAYQDHLAVQSPSAPQDYTMANGRGITLPMVANRQCPPFLLVLAAREGERNKHNRAMADLYLPLTKEQVKQLCPFTIGTEAYWDNDSQAVISCTVTRAGRLELERRRGGQADKKDISQVLLKAMNEYPLAAYAPEDDILQLTRRYTLAGRLLPDLGWAAFEKLLAAAKETAATEATSFKSLKNLNWTDLVLNQLPWDLQTALKEQVPTHFTMPRGQKTAITYEQDANNNITAYIAAHLQEFYGMKIHPTICRGRLPLKLHLLAPNGRPAQITADIVNFWHESYPAVRKDLFGRYPKHNWPEDPINAESCGLGRKYKNN